MWLSTVHKPKEGASMLKSRKYSKLTLRKENAPGCFHYHKKSISSYVDDYNHAMNGADTFNHLKAAIPMHRQSVKNWKALACFELDIALVNSFRLYSIAL